MGSDAAMTSTYGDGGTGGKLRRHPTRRQQSTPYARPPSQLSKSQLNRTEDGDGRASGWLSRIVDPAYRLITGSATRIVPSFFSKSFSAAALPSSDDDKDSNGDINCDDQYQETDLGSSRLLEEAGHSRLGDLYLDIRQENTDSIDNDSGMSEIEQLMRGKLFSRDEASRLTEILHSKAGRNADDQREMRNPSKTRQSDPSLDLSANELPRLLSEEKRENLNNARRELAATTPVRRPTLLEEVGASPVDIARAYMGCISTGIGTPFRSGIQDDRKPADQKDGFTSMSMVPPSLSKPSIYWPGAMVQEHRGYLTPQNPRSRFGLYSSQRSPYSRSIDSKSKLKHQPTPSVDRHASLHVSESPFRRAVAPSPTQGMNLGDASVDGSRSVGPIRPKRHNKVSHSAFRGSTIVASSSIQKPIADPGTLPLFFSGDPGSARSSSQFQHTEKKPYNHEAGIQSAHPHSSQMARRILDHIDRKVPTLREKSEEIRIASLGQKTSLSKLTTPLQQKDKSAFLNGFTSQSSDVDSQKLLAYNLLDISSSSTQTQAGDAGPSNSQKYNAPRFNSSTADEGIGGRKSYTASSVSNPVNGQSSSKTSFGAVGSELPVALKAQQSHSFGNKPALASISINRPNPSSGILFGNSSGFTFPVPASSGLLSEPPTPSITPAKVSHQDGKGLSTPSFTFGSKKTLSNLVFSFSSGSSLSDQVDDSDVKFCFGSDTTSRISFSVVSKSTIATK